MGDSDVGESEGPSASAERTGWPAAELLRALLDGSARARLAREHIRVRLERAVAAGRVTPAEAEAVEAAGTAGEAREYICGFGAHLVLKMILPPGSVGLTACTLAALSASPWPLLGILLTPSLRTAYTVSRMWGHRGQGIRYGTALAVGLIPMLGTLAYPAQMVHARPLIWRFLLGETVWGVRRFFARLLPWSGRAAGEASAPLVETTGERGAEPVARRLERSWRLSTPVPGRTACTYLSTVACLEARGRTYMLKVFRRLSGLLYNLRVLQLRCAGDSGVAYAGCAERLARERACLQALAHARTPAVRPAPAQPQGALLTEYAHGANGMDLLASDAVSKEEKLQAVRAAAASLRRTHAHVVHGDAQVKNFLLPNRGAPLWLDFDYVPNARHAETLLKARDLVFLIYSAARHSRMDNGLVHAALEAYEDGEVIDAVRHLRGVRHPLYHWFCHRMPFSLARSVSRTLDCAVDAPEAAACR